MTRAVPAFDELQIRLTPGRDGTYNVALSSAAGARATGAFALPFTDVELENFRLTVDPRFGRVRGRSSPQAERAREFGDALFGALIADGAVRDVYVAAAHDAECAGRGLRLTLYITAAPDLAGVPWEFLYRRPGFLAQSVWTPVVRYLDLDRPPAALSVEPPLRLLGMVSQPSGDGWEALDVGHEREKLEQALAPLVRDGYVTLRWLPGATLRDLQREVAVGEDFHVFHFIGHGDFDERSGQGSLVLEGAGGSPRYVDGETLGTVLCDRRTVRLAVLNACEAAKASAADPLAGVAAGLVQHDVPAVVGMQFAISDQAAITFATELYSGIARALPIDVAVTEGRRALASEGDLEWATPVLFMRVPDGRLFDVDLSAVGPSAPPRADEPDDHGAAPPPGDDDGAGGGAYGTGVAESEDEVGSVTRAGGRQRPGRRAMLSGAAVAGVALAVGIAAWIQSSHHATDPPAGFRAGLTDALKPVVHANRGLTGAVLSLGADPSPGPALGAYYNAADAQASFDVDRRRLPRPAGRDVPLRHEARRMSDYEDTYLRYVVAFLTGRQTARHQREFGDVSARLVRSLDRLDGLIPGAGESVGGAARLKRWANANAHRVPSAASGADLDAGSPPATPIPGAEPSQRAAPAPPEGQFSGAQSRTVAPGASVPIAVAAADAKGRRLRVRCDHGSVTVSDAPVRVTCTAFWRDGRTRSTAFTVRPQRLSGAATTEKPPAAGPAGKDTPRAGGTANDKPAAGKPATGAPPADTTSTGTAPAGTTSTGTAPAGTTPSGGGATGTDTGAP